MLIISNSLLRSYTLKKFGMFYSLMNSRVGRVQDPTLSFLLIEWLILPSLDQTDHFRRFLYKVYNQVTVLVSMCGNNFLFLSPHTTSMLHWVYIIWQKFLIFLDLNITQYTYCILYNTLMKTSHKVLKKDKQKITLVHQSRVQTI